MRELHDEALIREYDSMRLPSIPSIGTAPQFGKVQLPKHKFKRNLRRIISRYQMMEPAMFRLYNWMNEAWNDKLKDQSLILNKYAARDTHVTLPGELNQMMSIQSEYAKEFTRYLTEEWRRTVMSKIIDDFATIKDIDLYVAPMDVFNESRLKVLLLSIELRMAEHLRQLHMFSCNNWVSYVSGNDISDGPLLKVHLAVEENTGAVIFKPSIPEIEEGFIKAIQNAEDAVLAVKSIMTQEMLVMLQFPDRCIIGDSVIENNLLSITSKAKAKVLNILSEQLAGAKELAKKFADFALLTIEHPDKYWDDWETYKVELPRPKDVSDEDYEPEYETKTRTLEEYQEEIKKNFTLADEINTIAYNTEIFGVLSLDTKGITDFIVNHTKNMAYALMNRYQQLVIVQIMLLVLNCR